RVPGQAHHALVVLLLAQIALAGRAEVIDILAAFVDLVVGAELEAGVVRVAVEHDRAAGAAQAGGGIDEGGAVDAAGRQLGQLPAKRLAVPVVPVDLHALAAQHRPSGLADKLLVQLVLAVMAVPGVALAAVEGAAREAEEQPLVVRLEAALALGDQALP